MGYRHYFYKVKKADVETVKDMDYKHLVEYAEANGVEVDEWQGYKYINFISDKFLNKVEVYCLGKLYWDNTAERIYNEGTPLFSVAEVQKEFEDYVPYVVGKEGLLEAIRIYHEKVLEFYKDLLVDGKKRELPFGITLTQDDVKSLDKVLEHIADKIRDIYRGIVDTNDSNKWEVTSSWDYEYAIFNLVHILKSIDWEQDTLLFYGW